VQIYWYVTAIHLQKHRTSTGLRYRHGDPEMIAVQQGLVERMLDWYIHTDDCVPFDTDPRGYAEGIVKK